MIKFFLLLNVVCIFHGVNAGFPEFEEESEEITANTAYICLAHPMDASELQKQFELSSENTEAPFTESYFDNVAENLDDNSKENQTCGVNEILNNCPSESCEYCPTNDKESRACLASSSSPDKCPPAKCTCRNNYRRFLNGTCVPTRECPPYKCPLANEQFDACPLCPSDSCDRATPNGGCPTVGRIGIPLQCRPSCRCVNNFWRDGDRCVPYENCPNIKNALNCSLPNESVTCVRPCPPLRTCENRNKRYHCLVDLKRPCTYQCACDEGFYRNSDGFCVTQELCDKKCSGPNEEYKADKKTCPPEICRSIISRYACNPKEVGQPGCVCKPGFLRLNLTSTCILTDQCPELANRPPVCNLPNETAKCVKTCPPPRTCEDRNVFYRCIDNTNETCKFQCVCDDGFYRNSEGFCVSYDLCDKECSGPNEEYVAIKKTCPSDTCSSIVSKCRFDPEEIGQPGCACKSGFLRLNQSSTCIPTRECSELANQPPECSRPNESVKCVTSCPRQSTCLTRKLRLLYKCPDNTNETCKFECVCDDGFFRNSDGFCVTPDLCDKQCTGPNEEYVANKKTCPSDTCKSIVTKCRYDPEEVGQPGCVCKSGFLRLDPNSTCIPMQECPELANQNQTCGVNEILNNCPAESCEYCPTNDNEARACLASSSALVKCPPAKCTCRNNFKRLLNGTCVPTSECPPYKCPLANEHFDACPVCPSDDCDRARPNGDCPRVGRIGIPLQCQPSCRCEKNFWRDGDRCVPYEECPNIKKMLQCNQPNEGWKCVKPCPPPRTCRNRGVRFNCFNNLIELCKYDCVCNVGFYRNYDGYCVTSELCDKKCTGPNEVYKLDKKKCPPETCQSLLAQYKCDSKEKGQPGCVCKPGYLRLHLNSTCIPTCDCPKVTSSRDGR